KKVKDGLHAFPHVLDVAALNNNLLDVAATCYDTRTPHTHTRNPWMSDKQVRSALECHKEAQACHALLQTTEVRQAVGRAERGFTSARGRAMHDAHMSFLSKMLRGEV